MDRYDELVSDFIPGIQDSMADIKKFKNTYYEEHYDFWR